MSAQMSASPSPDEKQPSGAPRPDAPASPTKPATSQPGAIPRMPAAGPHAAPHLTNPDATPGTGILPPVENEDPEGEADAGTG